MQSSMRRMHEEYFVLAHLKRQQLVVETVMKRSAAGGSAKTSPLRVNSARSFGSRLSNPQPQCNFPPCFDYRLLAVIWAQFHFTI